MTTKKTVESNADDKSNDTESTGCACDKLVEIGFYRCQDNVMYITYLCEGCQKIQIKKYKLELLGELKYA